jgi:putative peptidoglycan lipid II flippase
VSLLRPSHAHSAFSATVLLMASTFLSRIIGLVRVKYIVWLFGSGMAADALNGAFVLPDMISYFLVGGAASITFVTILTRYRDTDREAEGERSLSVILTTMYLVLGAAILIAEIVAPWYIHWWFPGFDAQKAALCVRLTRILLPAQLCFFAGGVFGAVLLVRKQFSIQAVSPLIYGLGTIVGGVLLVHVMGVSSLAVGTVAGAFFGPFLLNYVFARRAGTRYRPILDWHDAGLREWVRLSLPLMVGVSLVTADSWIIAHFASATSGAVSLMSYAKQLFTAPMAVLAQAAGAASMPFFASLWSQQRRFEFATHVADSVSRVAALGLLIASGMVALAAPLVELLFLGGRFSSADSRQCAAYFAVFSVTMFLWAAQAIYARAFYAAGNTFIPMAAGTVVTLISWPMYASLYHWHGAMGLAIASDLGIALQTRTIAV